MKKLLMAISVVVGAPLTLGLMYALLKFSHELVGYFIYTYLVPLLLGV